MESLITKPRKSRFCCCAHSESSGDESVITIDRDSTLIFEPVPQQKLPLSKYAVDKTYIIPTPSKYLIFTIRHIVIQSKTCSNSALIPSKVSKKSNPKPFTSVLIKDEETSKSSEAPSYNFLSDKVMKKICKLLRSRHEFKNCLISLGRVCDLALHMAKFCNVISLEKEKIIGEMVQNNPMIRSQGFKINLVEGDVFSVEDMEAEMVILNLVDDYEGNEMSEGDLKRAVEAVEKCLKISNEIAVILPYKLDPGKFCEEVGRLRIDPCVEFIVFSDFNPTKYIIALFGKISQIHISEIVLNILGRLGIPLKNQETLKKIIDRLGLSQTLHILKQIETSKPKSASKAQIFFEQAKSQGCLLPELKILYQNTADSKLSSSLSVLKEFFFVYPTGESSTLIVDGDKIIGPFKILEYIEECKEDELNLNSLLGLIDG